MEQENESGTFLMSSKTVAIKLKRLGRQPTIQKPIRDIGPVQPFAAGSYFLFKIQPEMEGNWFVDSFHQLKL